ncbi:YycH protein [Gracilibacillus boraciitolerans JCM 21714]|uniref:YycH protein n=1 Tax=Gracilibacillus boraciitolerans JCM 21714 TaxID=1298598 RepID=W4VL31_9BACI|nr:two-component system activity regulator YycH [Gracilibacillus boraciitolerans]GAE93871.1 YycH protein [Gracilibacillus boraciitolerans JCM 21714]
MKIEVMKTVLLLFLVSLSLLLTLGIWNYQGDYETSGSDQATYSTLNGTEATKKELIQPSQLVIHEQEALMGFSDKQAELSVFNDILEWSLYDFEMIPENEEFKKDEKEKMIEIIFPASIPSYLIKELFHTDDSMLIDSQFNRIYLIADKNLTNRQIIFDNKNQDGIDIRASIQNISQVAEYFDRLGLVHDFTPLLSIEVNNQNKFYIPNQPNINGKKFRYQTFNLDSTDFQTVFFPKPANIVSSPNFDGGG